MPSPAQRRLAGFRFEVQPPPLPEKLPRMDIAVFVGFGSAGPLDVPVVIEDAAAFQQLFGDDLPLAWDGRRGRMAFAHLGPAVRAFFRNGGRRCWVIRVADVKQAESSFFPLPGLLERTTKGELRPAFARARSPGSSFDAFQCATALSVTPISVTDLRATTELVVRLRRGTELQAGDLLRVRPLDRGQHQFLSVAKVESHFGSPPALPANQFLVTATALSAFEEVEPHQFSEAPCTVTWTRVPAHAEKSARVLTACGSYGPAASPPDLDAPGLVELRIADVASPPDESFAPPVGTLLKIEAGTEALWFRVAAIGHDEDVTGSPPAKEKALLGQAFRVCAAPLAWPAGTSLVAEKLTFELHVRRGQNEAARLTELGFTQDHARGWNALPDDQRLFAPDDPPSKPPPADDLVHDDLLREARALPANGARFPLAGTDDSSSVFLPLLVQALPDEFLPAEHSEADEMTRDGLKTFHAGLFLDAELVQTTANSLLAEAEFIRYQRTNARRLRGLHAALEVEEATLIAVPDAVHPGWDPTESERIPDPAKSDLLPHPCWGLSEGCGDEPKPPTGSELRRDKFLSCALRVLEPPNLVAPLPPDSAGTFTLTWNKQAEDLAFVLEEATRPDFSDVREIYRGGQAQRTIFGRRPGTYFYRVRAEAGCETSNWSNELPINVSARGRYELRQVGQPTPLSPPVEFEAATLFDVHRSLLRLGAARGDLFAVLSLPEHFREDDCLNHIRLLQSAEGGDAAKLGVTPPVGRGESAAFSFGAVYHPWLITRDGDDEPLASPPDGAAVGVIARRSLERGAWIAPANEGFRGVIGLTPALPEGRRLDLLLAQLNQITQEPEGFLALNADTLSRDGEVRPINVRRLLMLLRRAALKRGADYVFEPNGPALRRLVQHAFEDLLNQLFVRGAFAGATRATSFEVVTDDSINTPQGMELGHFRVDLKVAPSVPMSFVTVRLVQTAEHGVATEVI